MRLFSIPRSALIRSGAALLAAAALLPDTAAAASGLSASATGAYGPGTPTQTATGGIVSDTESGSGTSGSNSSTVSASFGVLRLYGEAHSFVAPTPGLVYGSGNAFWRDDFLINSSTLNGQAGRLTLSFKIDGTLYGSTTESSSQTSFRSFATAGYTFRRDGGTVGTATQNFYVNNGETTGTIFLNQTQTFTIDFTFGTPFELRLEVTNGAISYGRDGTVADTFADLGHTATWGGFSSVTTAQGVPVPYTFSSTSGTNYQQAIVPEPGTYAMLLGAGAATLLVVLRRRGMHPVLGK